MLSAVQDCQVQQSSSNGHEQTIANLQAKVEAIPIIYNPPLRLKLLKLKAQANVYHLFLTK